MEANTVRVSLKRPVPFYVHRCKEQLKDQSQVELHALGEASSLAVRAAEMLVSLKYALLDKFETTTITESDKGGNNRRRYKVILKLTKSPEFDRAHEEFLKTKAPKQS